MFLHSLSPDKEYIVIGIADDYYTIVDDDKSPCGFSRRQFDVVDRTKPDDWVTEYGEDGERYMFAPEIGDPPIFEDYHDYDQKAISKFWRYMHKKGWAYKLPKPLQQMKKLIMSFPSKKRQLFFKILNQRISGITAIDYFSYISDEKVLERLVNSAPQVKNCIQIMQFLSSQILAYEYKSKQRYPDDVLFDFIAEYAADGLQQTTFHSLCESIIEELQWKD
ncbi:MAG: hypothetical protein KAS23_17375 [Anaerohalosphaera sp.]|nr:hypothetical protein [Anaerohalosphaera sp.]